MQLLNVFGKIYFFGLVISLQNVKDKCHSDVVVTLVLDTHVH